MSYILNFLIYLNGVSSSQTFFFIVQVFNIEFLGEKAKLTRENVIVGAIDYQTPVTQLRGVRG